MYYTEEGREEVKIIAEGQEREKVARLKLAGSNNRTHQYLNRNQSVVVSLAPQLKGRIALTFLRSQSLLFR